MYEQEIERLTKIEIKQEILFIEKNYSMQSQT